jgi:ribosomal 30S subunit maturation factor RimM
VKHSGEWRASKLVGLDVYNNQNDKIGDINEILLTPSGNVAGVVAARVGGLMKLERN